MAGGLEAAEVKVGRRNRGGGGVEDDRTNRGAGEVKAGWRNRGRGEVKGGRTNRIGGGVIGGGDLWHEKDFFVSGIADDVADD